MSNKLKKADFSIHHIGDVKTLVERVYPEHIDYKFYGESRSISRTLDFEHELYEIPEPVETRIKAFPPCKLVKLFHKSDNAVASVVIQKTTNEDLYFLLDHFNTGSTGYRWNNKFDRYKNLYLVYEALASNKEYKFTAIRHAISHPNSTSIVKMTVKAIFGEERIDLKKRKHMQTLLKLHEELLEKTDVLLVSSIIDLIKPSSSRFGYYVVL